MSSGEKRWTITLRDDDDESCVVIGPHCDAVEVAPTVEVERLKEALAFYADPANYTPYDLAPMERRVGERARRALHPAESFYACPTCGENVTRYGQRCPRCVRNIEEDRLNRG